LPLLGNFFFFFSIFFLDFQRKKSRKYFAEWIFFSIFISENQRFIYFLACWQPKKAAVFKHSKRLIKANLPRAQKTPKSQKMQQQAQKQY